MSASTEHKRAYLLISINGIPAGVHLVPLESHSPHDYMRDTFFEKVESGKVISLVNPLHEEYTMVSANSHQITFRLLASKETGRPRITNEELSELFIDATVTFENDKGKNMNVIFHDRAGTLDHVATLAYDNYRLYSPENNQFSKTDFWELNNLIDAINSDWMSNNSSHKEFIQRYLSSIGIVDTLTSIPQLSKNLHSYAAMYLHKNKEMFLGSN